MKCWKCGQVTSEGAITCVFCGASQLRSAPATEVGRALRRIYDRYGAQTVLEKSVYLVNGLGDMVSDAKKQQNQLKMAMDSGMGKLYLEQLKVGAPDRDFIRRVNVILTEDAGLSDKVASALMGWFDEMIGWTGAARGDIAQEPTAGAKYDRSSNHIIGIDLGTTFSRVAVMEAGEPVIIPTPQGGRGRPSAVGIKDGQILVCEEAQQSGVLQTNVPFKSMMGSKTGPMLGGKAYLPQFYAALIMRKLRQDAEEYLGEGVSEAVVTVPDDYTYKQRYAILEAGRIAGLKVRRIIPASAAAALAQERLLKDEHEHTVLVCNLGSGTFDASIVILGMGIAEVVTMIGDHNLGGNQFDECIAGWLAEEFRRMYGIDLRPDPVAMARLREAARKAKEDLSTITATDIYVPNLVAGTHGGIHLDLTLTRAKFDELTAPLIRRASDLIGQAFKDRYDKCRKEDITDVDKILLAGGASRIPAFRNMVREHARQAEILGVQPDECMALGAAVQAGIIYGNYGARDIVLLDATPYSLGIETDGGVFTKLIARNYNVPCLESQEFSTTADNQNSIQLHVLQGESENASENLSLGKFTFSGLPPVKKGVPRIEVTFDIDENNMISVEATEKVTGKQWTADVTSGLRTDEARLQAAARLAAEIVP